MPQQPITIIGAGIGGLTLGRCLLKHGIPAILYERVSGKPRHNYGITLHASSYGPLLKVLDLDEQTFRRRVAVDGSIDGRGDINPKSLEYSGNFDSSSFRARRAELEQLLREGLDVRWQHGIEKIKESDAGKVLCMSDGQRMNSDCIVGADGPHSNTRKQFLPNMQLNILPIVAFNGKRRVERSPFDEVYGPSMKTSNLAQLKQDNALLQVSVDGYQEDSVSVSWTYSRPAQGKTDLLHKPNRPNSEATSIPEEFFREISKLHDLPQPFQEFFASPEKLRKDRILHWLMRTILPSLQDLQALSQRGVFFIGDAVHAEPILGGEGANVAITDGVELAEWILNNGTESIANWYDSRYPIWEAGVRRSEVAIAEMHGGLKSAL